MQLLTLLLSASVLGKPSPSGTNVAGQCDKNFNVTTPEGLQALATCSTVTASITIALNATEIKLPALKAVKGDLTITARGATGIALAALEEVTGHFSIQDSLALETLDVGKLAAAKEVSILNSGSSLPLDFKAGLSASKVTVSHSRITTLSGLKLKEAELLDISGNTDLALVSIPDLQAVHGPLTFEANSAATLELASLTAVDGQLTLTGSKGAVLPKLKVLGGGLALDNTQFETITFQELTTIGQWLSIVQNDALTNVSFPALAEIKHGLNIQGNGHLVEIHLPALKSADGFTILEGSVKLIDLSKDFSSPGAANVTAAIDCEDFKKDKGAAFANIACQYSEDTPATNTTHEPPTTNTTKSKSSSNGAGSLAGLSLFAVVGLVVLAI